MNNTKNIKTAIALTAFLLLGTGISLAFKNTGVVSSLALDNQYAAVNAPSGPADNTDSGVDTENYLQTADLKKISKSSNLSVQEVASLVSRVVGTGNPGGCLSSGPGITVQGINNCKPPGPGAYTGNPFSPGMDFAPCTVSGVQGGTVKAVCFAGCCRAVSATGVKSALNLSGLSPAQMLQLGLKASQLFQGLFGGFGGGGGGGYYNPYTSTGTTTDNTYYTGTDTFVNTGTDGVYDFNSYTYDGLTESKTVTNLTTRPNAQPQTDKTSEFKLNEKLIKPDTQVIPPAPVSADLPNIDAGSIETVNHNTSDNKTIEFQILEQEKRNDPRIDKLRNPDNSLVRQSLGKNTTDYVINTPQRKSLWELIVEFITAPFK